MVGPIESQSQATSQELTKEEAIKLYAPVIEHIRQTHQLAADVMLAVKNRYDEPQQLDRNLNCVENRAPLAEEHIFKFKNYSDAIFERDLYPNLVKGKESISSYEVQQLVTGEDTHRIVMELPKVLEEEKKSALKMMEIFTDFLYKADTLHDIQDCIAEKTGLLTRKDLSGKLSEQKAIQVLDTSDIIELRKMIGEVNRLEAQFLLHRDRFDAATTPKQQSSLNLSDVSFPPPQQGETI